MQTFNQVQYHPSFVDPSILSPQGQSVNSQYPDVGKMCD